MNKEKIMSTLKKFKDEIENKGYNVYAIMLKSSQNYNLDDGESDIDANVVLIPRLHQIKNGVKAKFDFKEGEVTCHDIYSFAQIVGKGNPQWIEVCHTEYKIGASLDIFKDFQINPSALKGMAYEKVKAFDKLYPSRKHLVEKFGFDPKQLHHIVRLRDLLESGLQVQKYQDEEKIKYMMDIKRGRFPDNQDDAFKMRDDVMDEILELAEEAKLEYKGNQLSDEFLINLDKIVIDFNVEKYYNGN